MPIFFPLTRQPYSFQMTSVDVTMSDGDGTDSEVTHLRAELRKANLRIDCLGLLLEDAESDRDRFRSQLLKATEETKALKKELKVQ